MHPLIGIEYYYVGPQKNHPFLMHTNDCDSVRYLHVWTGINGTNVLSHVCPRIGIANSVVQLSYTLNISFFGHQRPATDRKKLKQEAVIHMN